MPELFTQSLELKALHFYISLTLAPSPAPLHIPITTLMQRHNPSNKVTCKRKTDFSDFHIVVILVRCCSGSGHSHRLKVFPLFCSLRSLSLGSFTWFTGSPPQMSEKSLECGSCFIWEVSTKMLRSSDSMFLLCVPGCVTANSTPIESETYQTKKAGAFLQSCSLVAHSLWCMLGDVGWAWPTTRTLSAPADVA